MNSHEFNFPDLETYKSNLTLLDKFDFSGHSVEDIYYKFFDLATTIPLCNKIFKPKEFNKYNFYRARLNLDKQKEDISLISTFSFPPTTVCTENNRANISTRTVFYCSDNPNSAIIECKPEKNSEGFLGIWKPVTNRDLKSGIFLPQDLPKENQWNIVAKNSYNHFINSSAEDKNFEHLRALHHFVNFKFRYENKPYNITSMIGHEVLYGNVFHDFIIYSSVNDNRYCNMAFHPNTVVENLRLEKVVQFKVIDVEKSIMKLGTLVGHVENSRIVWKKRTKEEEKLFKRM